MPCTTFLVGKDASYDGSTIVARNEDSPFGSYVSKAMKIMQPEDQVRVYQSVLSKVTIELPDNPMRYSYVPDAPSEIGVWGACGVNEANVAMTACETITSNARVLAADPLVEYIQEKGTPEENDYQPEKIGGISEEDMITIVLPYIHSAREGVIRLGILLEKYGTYEMNGIAFQDVDEIWWLETIGGHHWIAKRVPDDSYVMMPNQLGIDCFDFDDAFHAKKNHLCSSDLFDFIQKNHLDLSQTDLFNPRQSLGSNTEVDHLYNTPRAWIAGKYFNPKVYKWEGDEADYTPESNDIPWAMIPEAKITIEDVKYILSHHYQGTKYDPYSNNEQSGKYRSIGINRNNFVGITQIRPYLPEAIRSLQWMAFGSNVYNVLVPLYTQVNDWPELLANTNGKISTNNIYWLNRLIAALADPYFSETQQIIEAYQNTVTNQVYALIYHADHEYNVDKNISDFCEAKNLQITTILEKETQKVLDKVLFVASNNMKNAYNRSDA